MARRLRPTEKGRDLIPGCGQQHQEKDGPGRFHGSSGEVVSEATEFGDDQEEDLEPDEGQDHRASKGETCVAEANAVVGDQHPQEREDGWEQEEH